MVEEAEKFAEEDKAKVETIEARNELETYLYNARNSLREEKAKTVLGEDAKKGEDIAQTYLTWLESHGDETTQVYKDEMKKAEEEIKPIMMKMYAATTDKMPDNEGNMPGMHGQESGPKVEEVD
jgi:molecular chaperone DnaK (HSP70)